MRCSSRVSAPIRAGGCQLGAVDERESASPAEPREKRLSRERRTVSRPNVFFHSGRRNFAEEEVAAFLAMPTRFRADAAMVVHRCVRLAFISTKLARENAGMELCVNKFIRRLGLPHDQPGRRRTHVCTIQIGANTPAEFREMLRLIEARVRARGANLAAQRESVQDVGVVFRTLQVRMRMTA